MLKKKQKGAGNMKNQMLVTLDNNEEYVVLDTIVYNGTKYIYLVGYTNEDKMMFCIEKIENEQIKLIEVDNIELKQYLLKVFTEKLQTENI